MGPARFGTPCLLQVIGVQWVSCGQVPSWRVCRHRGVRVVVNMRWPVELVARVDAVAGARGRSAWVLGVVEAALAEASTPGEVVVRGRAVVSPRSSVPVPLPGPSGVVSRADLFRAATQREGATS